ncbi:MAG: hypothetical protein C4290_04450 [Chloroflexota bacterium]
MNGSLVLLAWQRAGADGAMMGLAMGMEAPLFLATWVMMTVAMMFPAAAPMILMFARVHDEKRRRGGTFVPTSVFVCSYVAVWTALGGLAYGLALAGERVADQSMWLMENTMRIGGGVLIARSTASASAPARRVPSTGHRHGRLARGVSLGHGGYVAPGARQIGPAP